MRQSTRIMLKKHGWRIDRSIHNYLYFRFYYPYVKTVYLALKPLKYLTWFKPLGLIGKMVFDRYHAKVLSSDDTRKIFSLNEDITVVSQRNKKIVPYRYATKIIFQEPTYIAVMDCPCKKSTDTCKPIQSCIAVGKGLASFWLEHCQKYNARRISQNEALDIIQDFRQSGHINQAFFKVATGGSTGVICNCCPECCVSLQATMLTRKIDPALSQSAPSGYLVRHNSARCTRCGTCERICHFNAVRIDGGKRTYRPDACMGCELCVEHCPHQALELFCDPAKPMPLDIDRIRDKTCGSDRRSV